MLQATICKPYEKAADLDRCRPDVGLSRNGTSVGFQFTTERTQVNELPMHRSLRLIRSTSSWGRALACTSALALALGVSACKKDDAKSERGGDVPPPAPSSLAKPGASVAAGTVDDPVSATFFPRSIGSYVLDPAAGAVKTYGAKAKLTMDQVCTTAFDGECEVYKRFGLARVVTLRYIDSAGGSGTVEVVLSQFENEGGGYGMFTKRVVADADPAGAEVPKAISAPGAAAMGGGRAYAWRGQYLVELTYMNEQEPPAKMVASSEQVLPKLAQGIVERLPGSPDKPAPTRSLPEANMVPLGVSYLPKDPMGIKDLGPAALGYYKDGAVRYRVLSAAPASEAAAKDAMKAVKAKPGALPVAGLGDEALQVVLQETKASPKVEWVFARKGTSIMAIGDEEFVLTAGEPLDKQSGVRLSKDDKVAKLKSSLK